MKKRNHQPVPVKETVFSEDIRRFQPSKIIKDGLSVILNEKSVTVKTNPIYEQYADLFDVILYNVGVFYCIAPSYFSTDIELDRPIDEKIKDLISLYYKRVDLDSPCIVESGIEFYDPISFEITENRAVVGLSGGKDSVYALVRAVETYGAENVKAVYVDNIMKQCPEMEEAAAKDVCDMLGVELFTVKISNSLKRHKGILNGAEIAFAAGLMIPFAVYFKASKLILGTIASEIDIYQVQAPTFSETIPAINLLNGFLMNIGLNVQVISGVPDIKSPMTYLMQNRPDIMSKTVSCMMKSNHLKSHIHRSRRNYDGFPFYERMCGVCAKCMMINVFRFRYDISFQQYLTNPSISKYALRVLKALSTSRLSFKAEVVDEMEEILDETLMKFELNI